MNAQRLFYQELFTSKGCYNLENSRYYHYLKDISKLLEDQKKDLDKDIDYKEVDRARSKCKDNKAPGPDGFTNEFFKIFIKELGHWIYKAIQDFIKNERIPESIICGTITCIPKVGKIRTDLKNWRPITLLNSVYKFFSQIISDRIRS